MADTSRIDSEITRLRSEIRDRERRISALEAERTRVTAEGEWWKGADKFDSCPECGEVLKDHAWENGRPVCVAVEDWMRST